MSEAIIDAVDEELTTLFTTAEVGGGTFLARVGIGADRISVSPLQANMEDHHDVAVGYRLAEFPSDFLGIGTEAYRLSIAVLARSKPYDDTLPTDAKESYKILGIATQFLLDLTNRAAIGADAIDVLIESVDGDTQNVDDSGNWVLSREFELYVS